MRILKVAFENYRNLDGLIIEFPTETSFIIGENGIGKSNILNALSKIFIYGKFSDMDFFDADKNIKVLLKLFLDDEEIGSFDDYVSPLNKNQINLIIEQASEDNAFKVVHYDSGEEISNKLLKNVFYIYYDSLRNPKTELSFEKDKGSGSFLNFLIKYFLQQRMEADESYVDKSKLTGILNFINNNLGEIQAVKRNDITVNIDSNNLNFLNSIFQLYDNQKIELKKSGYGVQFSLLVVFSLFERIIEITQRAKKRGQQLDNINCILAFDEPEIHLHPFAQRALIKDLTAIANGKDEGFNKILKEMFGISSFSAQLLIVSHSDRIICGGYENIVRLYPSQDNKIKAISGCAIHRKHLKILGKNEKHLQKQFPYFCEALFSKKVIFVEGESELGAFPKFFEKMSMDIDSLGISIINTYGEGSMNPLIKIFSLFQIDCLGIKDRDVYNAKKKNGSNTDEDDQLIKEGKLVLTTELNFEYEIVNSFIKLQELYDILEGLDKTYVATQQKNKVNDFIQKFDVPGTLLNDDLKWSECCDDNLKRLFLLVALTGVKSITAGSLLAEALPLGNIPKTYKETILRLTA